jgi:hypothetical protein
MNTLLIVVRSWQEQLHCDATITVHNSIVIKLEVDPTVSVEELRRGMGLGRTP